MQVFRPLLLLAASTFLFGCFGCQRVAASPLLLSTSAQIVELESLKALRGLYVARKPVNVFMKSATEALQLKYSVEKRVIIYESTDKQGNTIKNSAAVLVPLIPPGSSAAGMSGESGDYADCAGCPTILYHFDGGIGMVDNVEQEVPTAQAITLETNLPFPYMMYLAMWASSGAIIVMPDGEGRGVDAGSAGTVQPTQNRVHPFYQPGTYKKDTLAVLAAVREFLTATEKCVPSGRLHVVGTFEGAFAALASQAALEADSAQSKGEASGFRLVSVHPLAGATDLVAAQRSYSVAETNGTYVSEGQWIVPFWMYASMQYTSSSKSPSDVFTSPLSGTVGGAFAPKAKTPLEIRALTNQPVPLNLVATVRDSATGMPTEAWLVNMISPPADRLIDPAPAASADTDTFPAGTATFSPRASTFSCGSPDDAAVPISSLQAATKALQAQKTFSNDVTQVRLDQVTGTHVLATQLCLIATQNYILHSQYADWNAHDEALYPDSAVSDIRPVSGKGMGGVKRGGQAVVDSGIMGVIHASVFYSLVFYTLLSSFVFYVIWSAVDAVREKFHLGRRCQKITGKLEKKPDGKRIRHRPVHDAYPSACDIWLEMLVNMPCVFFLVGMVVPAYLSYAGLMTSMTEYGTPMPINLDFGSYITADTALARLDNVHSEAKDQQDKSLYTEPAAATAAGGRRQLGYLDAQVATSQSWINPVRAFWGNTAYNEAEVGDEDVAEDDEGEFFSRSSSSSLVSTSASGRRHLATTDRRRTSIEIFYQNRDRTKTVFTKKCLEDIKAFEAAIRAFEDFDAYCYWDSDAGKCMPFETPINIFYATILNSNASTGTVQSAFDGAGSLRDINQTLQWLATEEIFIYTDSKFSLANLSSTFTRTHISYGSQRTSRAKSYAFLDKLWAEVMFPATEETGVSGDKYPNILISISNSHLTGTEVMFSLVHDAKWAIGSFIAVGGLVLFHLKLNLFLWFAGMYGVIISFTASYYFYSVQFGFKEMPLLNFVALFLILGIGADDIFVLYDTYHHAVAFLGPESSFGDRIKWAYREAGSAMLVTSVTTTLSFYSNVFSVFNVVKSFGAFMGTCVTINFINVLIIMPSALLINDLYINRCLRFVCAPCCPCVRNCIPQHPPCRFFCIGHKKQVEYQKKLAEEIAQRRAQKKKEREQKKLENGDKSKASSGLGAAHSSRRSLSPRSPRSPRSSRSPRSPRTGQGLWDTALSDVLLQSEKKPPKSLHMRKFHKRRNSVTGTSMNITLSAAAMSIVDRTLSTAAMSVVDSNLSRQSSPRRSSVSFGSTEEEEDSEDEYETDLLDHIDPNQLDSCEHCFYGCFSPLMFKGRIFVIIVSLALTVVSGYLGATNLKLSSGGVKVFEEKYNQGRLQAIYQREFSSISLQDLNDAIRSTNEAEKKVSRTCPGLSEDGSFCNKHGECDVNTYECTCADGWAGSACNFEKKDYGILAGAPTSTKSHYFISGQAETTTWDIELQNVGDADLAVDVGWGDGGAGSRPDWLTVGNADATIEAAVVTQSRVSGKVTITVTADVSSKGDTFEGTAKLVISARSPGQGSDMVVDVNVEKLSDPLLSGLSANGGISLSSSFARKTFNYQFINLAFDVPAIEFTPSFSDPPCDSVKMIFPDSTEEPLSSDAPSTGFTLANANTPYVFTIRTEYSLSGITKDYVIRLVRDPQPVPAAPSVQGLVAGVDTVKVIFKPGANSESAKYKFKKTVGGGSASAVAGEFDSCASTVQCPLDASGTNCCEQELSGMDTQAATSIAVQAFIENSNPLLASVFSPGQTMTGFLSTVEGGGGTAAAPVVSAANKPTIVITADGDVTVKTEWSDIDNGGSSPITGITCAAFHEGSLSVPIKSESKTCPRSTPEQCQSYGMNILAITGLANPSTQNYQFACKAWNSVGSSSNWGIASDGLKVSLSFVDTPSQPTAVLANGETGKVTVTVTKVEQVSENNGYECTSSPGDVVVTSSAHESNSNLVVATFAGTQFAAGTAYTFTCTGENSNAESDPSAASDPPVTVTKLPGPPGKPTLANGNTGELTVTDYVISSTADRGGSAATAYTCTASPDGAVASGTGTSMALTGLTDGTDYTVSCTVTTSVGTSSASPPSDQKMCGPTATAPTSASAVFDKTTGVVTLVVTPVTGLVPAVPADGYNCQHKEQVSGSWTGAKDSTANEVVWSSGLVMGKTYDFRCKSTNAVGSSEYSASSLAFVTPFKKPLAPTTSGDGNAGGNTGQRIDVTVTDPTGAAKGGASNIASRICELSSSSAFTTPIAASSGAGTNSITYTGLTNGDSYYLRCKVTTDAPDAESRESDWSATRTLIVGASPSTPSKPDVSRDDDTGQVFVAITPVPAVVPPVPNTGYTCTSSPGSVSVESQSELQSGKALVTYAAGTLARGTEYTFTCTADNSVKESGNSPSSDAIAPLSRPGAPTSISVTKKSSGVFTVAGNMPGVTGNANSISSVACVASPGAKEVTSATFPMDFTGMTNGQIYSVSCTSTNSDDKVSQASLAGTGFTATVPNAPPTISAVVNRGGAHAATAKLTVSHGENDNGGEPLRQFTCECSTCDPVISVSSSMDSAFSDVVVYIPGLDALSGRAASFRCKTRNVNGDSASWSATEVLSEVQGKPVDVPTVVESVPGNELIVVTVDLPTSKQNSGGVPATNIKCRTDPGGLEATVAAGETEMSISGVTNGQEYRMECALINEFGEGPWGDTIVGQQSEGATPGFAVQSDVTLENVELCTSSTPQRSPAGCLNEDELRTYLANALGVSKSQVVLGASGAETGGGRRLDRRVSPHVNRRSLVRALGSDSYRRRRLGLTIAFKVNVASPASFTPVSNAIDGLASDTDFRSDTGTTGVTTTPARLASEEFMNSKLRATTGLSVRSTQGGAPLILYDQLGQGRSQVSFDPDAAAYWIESSSNTLWLSASVAEPAYAAVGLVGGSIADDGTLETEVTLDQLGETTLEVRVTAGDLTTRTYTIVATLLAKQCSPECTTAVAEDRATCDGITGECTCKAGWKGANCDADCPGDCNGVHGTCALQTNKTCICEPTYSGRGCTNRVCPACLNNATCTEAYTCSCADGFKGALCETKTCQTAVVDTPCSGHGTCNTLSAECKCAKGWVGGDCNTKKLHIKNCVAVQVWFGIEGPASNNLSAPVYDPNFDLADPAAQKWLHHVCTRARARKDLVVRSDWPCWVESFKDSVAELGMTFPIPRPLMSTAVDILYDNSNFKTLYNRQIGTAGTDYGGQMLYTYVSMRIELDNRRGNVGNLELLEHQARWQKFMLEMNADAPSSMKGGVVTSTTWTAADTEQGLIDSTLQTWAISNGGVLLVILLFTQNLLISTYAMLTIVLIVISLMGFLFAIVGFEFGAIEAVGVTIFVGMSVDYCLHVAHGYHSSESITKKEKTTEALTALGVSILGAALTTASSSAFLFPCRIYLFVQLGIMLTSNTILAVFFALMFLVALLMLAGPTRVSKDHHRQWCDVVSVLLCDCLRCSNYGKAAKMSHKKKKYAVDDDSEGKSVDLPVSRQSRRVTTAKVSAVGSSGAPLPRSQSKNMTSLPPLPAGNHPDEVGIEMMTNPHVESLRGRGPKEDSAELI